jgi:hypothetical protein
MPIQREVMKESVMKPIVVAAAMAAAVWGLRRWIDYQRARMTRRPAHSTETWENEGGALAPHPAGLETSQVPR